MEEFGLRALFAEVFVLPSRKEDTRAFVLAQLKIDEPTNRLVRALAQRLLQIMKTEPIYKADPSIGARLAAAISGAPRVRLLPITFDRLRRQLVQDVQTARFMRREDQLRDIREFLDTMAAYPEVRDHPATPIPDERAS